MHESLDSLAHLDEGAEGHELGDSTVDQLVDRVAVGEDLPRVGLRGLQRERDALLGEVDVENFHVHFVTDGDDLTRVVDVLPAELRDVNESVHAAEVHEGAEVDDRGDDAVAAFAGLEVRQEVTALFLLGLFEPGAAREHDVVAVTVEFDDLGFDGLADVGLELTHAAKLDQRRGQESTQANVDDESALDDLDDDALDDLVAILQLFDVAPGLFVLRALLGEDESTLLVLLLQDEALDALAQRDNVRRIGVIANGEFSGRDDALGLEADVQEDFVVVDLHDGAGDEVAVFEFEHAVADEGGEVGADHVVFGDDARNVISFSVEGSHFLGGEEAGAVRHRYYFREDHTGVS